MDDGIWECADSPYAPDGPTGRSGKWMLFSSPEYHDDVWKTIKAATEVCRLGTTSKTVSRSRPEYGALKAMVTCVYTYDFEDRDDVRRVLGALRDLGFSQNLAYKTDIDTLLGHYGDGVSVYTSPRGSLDFEDRRDKA